jgi:hypothetical protein
MTYKTKRIRTTIPVSPEVHEVFGRMAAAAGIPLGRAMADWLQDTMEGAQFVAAKMEQARATPRQVMLEFRGLSVGLTEEADKVLEHLRNSPEGGFRAALAAANPPSSNTGVKSPPPSRKPGARNHG